MAGAGRVVGVPAQRLIRACYLAADGFAEPLAEELSRYAVPVEAWHGRLALSSAPAIEAAWAEDTWTDPTEIPVSSVKDAADVLRAVQRNWAAYAPALHRRMALIEARLPPVAARPLVFPAPAPTAHLGAWTLLAADRLLFSPRKTSPVPNGAMLFEEDHLGPPSRAYLKLWEALTWIGERPSPGACCVDLGAAPGGWTWVLASLGATVVAVDKAALESRIAAMPGVTERRESAFGLAPEAADWLFSDVIAYPDRLLTLVQNWIAAGAVGRIVCTVKLQGATDHAAVAAFAAIPGGRLRHLHANKHELTFYWRRPQRQ